MNSNPETKKYKELYVIHRAKKAVFFLFGAIFFVFGFISLAIPLSPGIIFMFVGLTLLVKSSERFSKNEPINKFLLNVKHGMEELQGVLCRVRIRKQ